MENQIEKDTCTPMFFEVLFTIARIWKQPRCPSTDEWIKKLWYIYTMEYFFLLLFSHSVVSDSVTPGNAACQAFLSFIMFQSLLKFKSIESMIPSNHLISCRPLLYLPSIFPSNRVLPVSQFFVSSDQIIGASALASVLSMNIQG